MEQILSTMRDPLVWPPLVVSAVALVAFVAARWSTWVSRLLGLAAAAAMLVGAGRIVLTPGVQTFARTWADLGAGLVFRIELTTSPLGNVVLAAAAVLAALVAVFALGALAGTWREGRFFAYLGWTLAGTYVVAMAGNLLVLLIGWEIVTLMLFLMINQGRRTAQAGAAKTYGVLGFADACLLLGLAMLAIADGGTANWSLTAGARDVASLGAGGYAAYVLILIAALAKAGAIPVHSWIPAAATDAPTPAMALLPASLDKLLGIYLLATLCLRVLRPDWTLQVIMMVIGGVTILAAVLMAMMQHNLKRLLAFHAVSQVGYMVLGIATGTVVGIFGGLLHMLNNAIYKSNLFLMSHTVGRASGTDEIENMGGLAKALPVTFACSLIAALSISGVPPLNGFVSKWMIYQGTIQIGPRSGGLASALLVAAVFGSALTLASFIKVMYSAFLSAPPADRPKTPAPRERLVLVAPMVVLAAACVVIGLWPQGILRWLAPAIPGADEVAVTATGIGGSAAGYIWSPGQATGLIVLGMLGGAVLLLMLGATRKVRVVRPFVGGEVPGPGDDRFRIPATGFYATIAHLPIVGPLLAGGEQGAMDPYHWSGRHGNTFVQMLRKWHTGLISLYVAWCLLGLTVTLLYLLLAGRT